MATLESLNEVYRYSLRAPSRGPRVRCQRFSFRVSVRDPTTELPERAADKRQGEQARRGPPRYVRSRRFVFCGRNSSCRDSKTWRPLQETRISPGLGTATRRTDAYPAQGGNVGFEAKLRGACGDRRRCEVEAQLSAEHALGHVWGALADRRISKARKAGKTGAALKPKCMHSARCLRPPAVAVRPATVANRSTSGSTLVRQGLIRDDYDNPRADLGAPTDAAVLAQGALRFLSPP